MSEQLLHLVAMKLIWPRGPGPILFKTELLLNAEIEKHLLESIERGKEPASLWQRDVFYK